MTHSVKVRGAPGKAAENEPIVRPVVPKKAPEGGAVAVMVGTRIDLSDLLEGMGVDPDSAFPLFLSRLYGVTKAHTGFYLAGPMMGAPYAVMILETLIAMGVKQVLFYGWSGAVAQGVEIGDILIPTEAVIDEGTSRHYRVRSRTGGSGRASGRAHPSAAIQDALRNELIRQNLTFRDGPIWTTDAIFRETVRKTAYYQRQGILAVEMEASALFSAGQFHGIQVGSIMVVSDEISSLKWRPGFRDDRFRCGRRRACKVIQSVCQAL
ncbi:MAG: purine-nucleoside phosphorylase [Desulfobacterales bacterium CG23_combo_of_CG06-09_8_20_14_all_52_9]|nr:MAG: purine-nucleoside phosphorylase [Desulfobacterales bacterium CG23_combo_of_CG06-09_8_20_14_all_52_9]